MSDIIAERVCADTDGPVVVFLIGVRINKPWKFWSWLPVARAMPRMLSELAARPDLGLLHVRALFGLRSPMLIQYWQSEAHLLAYAQQADGLHLPAWREFNRRIGTNGDVGIWHETYVVPRGHAEAIYVNMPRYGLGQALGVVPAKGPRASAAKRLSGVDLPG